MDLYPLSSYKTVEVIKDFGRTGSFLNGVQGRRSAIPIAIIDDNPFEASVSLKNYGYRVSQIGDLKKISEISEYPLVLCDLMGVGVNFDRNNQGVSIIREIRRNYPANVVVAYTGAAMNSPQAAAARFYADAVLKKDIDNDEWVEKLDKFVELAADPYEIWLRMRNSLSEFRADTKDILKMEDGFVRSILERDSSLTSVTTTASSLNVSQDVRNVITNLAASVIFKVIFG